MEEKKRVLAVVGPTASGKTALAVQLAKKYDGEIPPYKRNNFKKETRMLFKLEFEYEFQTFKKKVKV